MSVSPSERHEHLSAIGSESGPEALDTEVFEGARRGERAAFEAIFRKYAPSALGFALVWTRNRPLAEEALQEGFARAWSRMEQLRDPARFGPWFWRIIMNCARDAVRDEARRKWAPSEWAPDEWPAPDTEERAVVAAAVRALPRDLRAVVCLRYLADLSEGDTAQALGWPKGTVKSRLHRARRLLTEGLSRDREEGS